MTVRRLVAALATALALVLPPAAARSAEAAFAPFVWEVTTPRETGLAPRHDYLLGTMHVPMQATECLPARVQGYMVASTAFVMEADLSALTARAVRRYTTLGGGRTLEQLLPAAAWPKLVALAAEHGIAEGTLKGIEPWYLALLLTMAPGTGEPVMDEALRDWAEQGQVSVRFLETAEEQLRILDSVRMEEDVKQLMELLDDPVRAERELAELEARYRAGDLSGLTAMLFEPERLRDYPDFYRKLFAERNARWLPRLMRQMDQEDLFVAVGLGHLVGDRGLVHALKARGYRVEQVSP